MINLNALLKAMVEKGASDLHLRAGLAPTFRINGELFKVQLPPLSPADMEQIIHELLSDKSQARFELQNELDSALSVSGVGRFRLNISRQRSSPMVSIRAIRIDVPALDELHVPSVIADIAMRKRGLILVTGTTGSGKSTLLASMIRHINNTVDTNIVTIEDPIEYLHRDNRSIIAQREVGSDTDSFAAALRASFRQDPDVIMIGEIRDKDTMETALTAADTGHLVMSTLHTMNAVETISRIVSFFPPHEHQQVRLILSGTLVSIVSLRLLIRKDENGRVPAVEILVNNAAMAEYLADADKTHMIQGALSEGYTQYGSQSFDQSLLQLYQEEQISYETAKQNASNPDDFELKVAGVQGTSDRRWIS